MRTKPLFLTDNEPPFNAETFKRTSNHLVLEELGEVDPKFTTRVLHLTDEEPPVDPNFKRRSNWLVLEELGPISAAFKPTQPAIVLERTFNEETNVQTA